MSKPRKSTQERVDRLNRWRPPPSDWFDRRVLALDEHGRAVEMHEGGHQHVEAVARAAKAQKEGRDGRGFFRET